MTEEEDKWWSPGHVDTEDDETPTQSATEDSSNEEIIGRENIDNFMDQIRDPKSGSKEKSSGTIVREDGAPSPQPPVVSGGRGFLGLWWLTRGEALFVVSATVFALIISAIWTAGLLNESTYAEVSATIVAEEDEFWTEGTAEVVGDGTNGTGWFMDDLSGYYQDCWTDEDGYEYCENVYVVEYECYADLYLSWNVSGVEYSDWAYTPSIITPYGCLGIMEDYYRIGITWPIWYAASDPSQFQAFTITLGAPNSTYWFETMYHYADGPNLFSEYECGAILTVTYPDPSYNTTQITTRVLDGWNGDPAYFNIYSYERSTMSSSASCISELQDVYADGSQILVMVDSKDSSKAYQQGNTPGGFFLTTWFCCLGLMVILVILSFVAVRFNNTPPGSYVTRNGVVRHGGYDGDDVTIINHNYGNRWGYNEGPGVHFLSLIHI